MNCNEYKLGASLATLVRLPDLNLPDPQNALYSPFSVRYQAGDGSIKGDGFPTAEWQFIALSRDRYNLLLQFFQNVLGQTASQSLYIRTRTNDRLSLMWQNFSAHMILPDVTGADGIPAEQDIRAFLNLKVKFVYLVAS